MRLFQGIFANDRVLILEFGTEYPWEGIMRGLTKEIGEYYYYIIEDLSSKVHYVPRDAIQRISRIEKNKKKTGNKNSSRGSDPILKLVR